MPRRTLPRLTTPLRRLARADLSVPRIARFSLPPVAVSACIASGSTSLPCWLARNSVSRKSTTAFGSSASCTMIWDTSIWSRKPCNPSTTRSARGCHPCLRYDLLPMSPGRTPVTYVSGPDKAKGGGAGGIRTSDHQIRSLILCNSLTFLNFP